MNDPDTTSRAHELDRGECLDLLRNHSKVGRVGFVKDGQPSILPVNYLAEETTVYFCTQEGTELSRLDGQAVAFEVDSSRSLSHSGWSVLVQGVAESVSDPQELDRLERSGLQHWAWTSAAHWMRIPVGKISGRRIPER